MLVIEIDETELFDEKNNTFIKIPKVKIELEHSLLAISKWESKYQIPFLGGAKNEQKTNEQILDYVHCMVLTDLDDPTVLNGLSSENLRNVNNYIESKESATTFGEMPKSSYGRSEIVTSELIYYWMVAFNIPFECERWNLNRLFALIKICNIKNSPTKKMPKHSIAARNRELNNARRAQYNSAG